MEEVFEIVNADDAVIFVEVFAETIDALLPLAETEFAIEVVPLESGEFTFTLNVAVCPVAPAAREFREMSGEQLKLTMLERQKELFQFRLQSATDRLETPSQIRKAKKDLARIMTIQREREISAAKLSAS